MRNLLKKLKKGNIIYINNCKFSNFPYRTDLQYHLKNDMKDGLSNSIKEELFNLYKNFIDAMSSKDKILINSYCQKQLASKINESLAVSESSFIANNEKSIEIESLNIEFHMRIGSDRAKNDKLNIRLHKTRSNEILT